MTQVQTTIAIVGCGGLGVPAAWTLALAGAPRLVLIDDDTVEVSNLHRQILYDGTVLGQSKPDALRAALQARMATVDIEVRQGRLSSDTLVDLLAGCDAVLEGSDDATSKFLVNDWAVAQPRRRFASIAAAIGRRGQWMAVSPESSCYRCLFEEPPPPELLATCQVAGVIGPVVGQVGALAARSLWAVLNGQPDMALGALVRLSPRGLLRTPVQIARDCRCGRGQPC